MAFFDDLGKAFNNAGQKTKNMADAAKLNSSISEEERKLNSLYAQIGHLYVQLHPEDYEEPFADLFRTHTESCQKIDEMRKRVKELKNIISCPGCGADMSGDAAFCSVCGYRMPPKVTQVPQGPTKCVSCGTAIAPGMNFCTGCGTPVPPPAPVQPVAPTTCRNCNSQLEPGSAFCVVCGTPVGSAAPVPASVPTPVEVSAPVSEPVPMEEPVVMPASEEVLAPEEIPAPLSAAVVCPNCGTTLDYDSMFCIECGTKVR